MKKFAAILIIISLGCKTSESLLNEKFNYTLYTNSLFPVKYDEHWGYADFYGKTVISPQFEEASLFHNGIAIVKQNNLYGYISINGQWLIKPKYISAHPFDWHWYKKSEDDASKTKLLALVDDGKGTFYINKNGRPFKGRVSKSHTVSGCNIIASRLEEYSTINEDKTYEITYQYWKAKNDSSYNKVIDTTDLRLDTIIELDPHFALLSKDSKYAIYFTYISLHGRDATTNKLIIVPKDSVHLITPDFVYEDVKFKNKNGEIQRLTIFKKNGKWGILNIGGPQFTPFIYEDIEYTENFNNYLVEFEPQKFGYISIIKESHYVLVNRESYRNSVVVEHFNRHKVSKERR